MKEKEGNFMMTILYEVGNKLYLNITNRCPCSCTFCIRNNGDGAYGSDSLWLEREPTVQEVIEQLEKTDLNKYAQVVFCGYGEPLERINDVAEICMRYTNELPPQQKLVFMLRDVEELEVIEVQTITGLSPEKIKSTLYLARKNIRNKMNQIDPDL